ncbi:hypothetical protein [Pseudonocardia nigra]|uniref:hypothetical protein n=1 Tax=Pseudonocardia nigra TaxID=1921578 RepID=UPI001C5E8E3C|nr:hypothetical protein [Pseudonocardia nigra]
MDAVLALGLLFALAAGSAVVPVAGVEAFLVGYLLLNPGVVPWWLAGLVTALGQLTGKAVHVVLAGRVAAVPEVHRRLAGTMARCRRRPRTAAGIVLLSASVGLPPFTAVVPAAAASGLDLRRLVPVAAAGRIARFLALAGIPELLAVL